MTKDLPSWLSTSAFAPGTVGDTAPLSEAAGATMEDPGFERVEHRDLLARLVPYLTMIQRKLLYACVMLDISKRDLAAHAGVSHAVIYNEFKKIRKVADHVLKDETASSSVEYKVGTRPRGKGKRE